MTMETPILGMIYGTEVSIAWGIAMASPIHECFQDGKVRKIGVDFSPGECSHMKIHHMLLTGGYPNSLVKKSILMSISSE